MMEVGDSLIKDVEVALYQPDVFTSEFFLLAEGQENSFIVIRFNGKGFAAEISSRRMFAVEQLSLLF